MPTPTHQVYRVLLKVDGIHCLWTFRIHDDDTLHVEIEREYDSLISQKMTIASMSRDFDQHVDVTYSVANQVLKRNTPSLGLHTGEFLLAQRFEDEEYCAYNTVKKCKLHHDEFYKWDVDDEEDTFDSLEHAVQHPVVWSVAEEPVRATLFPLSCGFYTLKGALTYHRTRSHSPIIMYVELLPGGHVGGTGIDSGYHTPPLTVPLSGTWTADSLEISQSNFVVNPPSDVYHPLQLHDPVSQYAFHAQWIYGRERIRDAERPFLQANLHVTSMQRHWVPEIHRRFPEKFREAVRWCLLSSLRREKCDNLWIPSVLWPHVFRFCDSSWFV